MKDGEESFYLGGKYKALLNEKILLCNSGKTWAVPINMKNKDGDIIYKTRFFVNKDFDKDKDSDEVIELKSIIKSQQDIIDKMTKSLKIKSEEKVSRIDSGENTKEKEEKGEKEEKEEIEEKEDKESVKSKKGIQMDDGHIFMVG